MGTIAELGVKIDSADAIEAKATLDEMAKAGGRAELSMAALEQVLSKEAKTTKDLAVQREALTRLTATATYSEKELAKYSKDLDKSQIALTKSAMDEQKALNSLLGAIDPTRAALAKLDAQVDLLNKSYKDGNVDQAAYAAGMKKFNAQYDEIEKGSSVIAGLGLNTKTARQNMIQLGNALAGGNIKVAAHNIFELGANAEGSALRMAAMAAPIGLVTAALGGLAYAYLDAVKQAREFNAAINGGTNGAGQTISSLKNMADVAGRVTGNMDGARDAVVALASGAATSGTQMRNLAEAAAAMSEVTGQGAGELAKSFATAGDTATEAAGKLSSQYGLLTLEQYQVIKGLDDQGDSQRALDVLSEDLNQAALQRLKSYRESLSDLERDWDKIKTAIKGAYGEVRSEIFPDLAKQIEITQRVLDTRKGGGVAGAISNGLSSLNTALGLGTGEHDDSTEALERKLASLKSRLAASTAQTAATGEATAANQKAIEAQRALDAQLDNINPLNKRKAAQDKLNLQFKTLYENAEKTGQKSPLLDGVSYDGAKFSGGAYDTLLKGLADKNKDPKTPSAQVDLTGFNNAKNNLADIVNQYKNTQKELDAAQKAGLISQSEYALKREALIGNERDEVTAAYEAEISALEAAKAKKTTTAAQSIQLDQKIADARAGMVKAQKDADSQLEVLVTNETGRLARQERSISTYVQALAQQQRALELAGQRAVLGVGQGDRQNALSAELNAQQDRFAQQSLELANQKTDPSRNMSEEEFQRKSQALADANKAATDQIRQNYADVEAAQGDWTKGATAAWANYLDSAKNIAGQTKSLFGNAFSSMEDAVVNFAMTGKLSFADFTKSILADMARIAVRQASSSLLSSLFWAGLSYFSGGGGGNGLAAGSAGAASSNLGASASGYSGSFFPQANGGAWSGGVQLFANGGAFTNTIVSKPTAFGMANGKTGIMGEAGEEAIMPLARTSSGKLGVIAAGGGAGTAISISVPVSVTTQDRSSEGMQIDQQALSKSLQSQMQAVAEKAVAESWRPGGTSFRNVNGRV